MGKLREEMEAFTSTDPYRAIRLTQTSVLVQSVSALAAAGASLEDIHECFEAAIEHARRILAHIDQNSTPGENLDRTLKNKLIV